MLLSDYIETLTEGQRLIIKDVAAEARKSASTKSMLISVRRSTAKAFLKLWGEDIFPAKVKLGYEPDWAGRYSCGLIANPGRYGAIPQDYLEVQDALPQFDAEAAARGYYASMLGAGRGCDSEGNLGEAGHEVTNPR